MDMQRITAQEIIDNTDFDIAQWYAEKLKGRNSNCVSCIYLDLTDMTLFGSFETSENMLSRDDGSLKEVAIDKGWGCDLTDAELEWLNEDGVMDFGYCEWLNDVLEPNIQFELDIWYGDLP